MAKDSPPILSRQRKFAAKIETTTGTKASLTAAEAVTRVFDVRFANSIEQVARPVEGSLSNVPMGRGVRSTVVTFSQELYGGATVPYWANFLRASGYSDAVTPGVFLPLTGATDTMTMGRFAPGRVQWAIGCMGTGVMTFTRAQIPKIDWTFTGAFDRPSSSGSLTGITYEGANPPVFKVATFTTGSGDRLVVPEVVVDLGNTVVLREDIEAVDSSGDPTGYRAAYISERNPRIRIRPEAMSLAARDWFAGHRDGTLYAFELATEVEDNWFKVTAPKLQLTNPPDEEDDQGMVRDSLEFMPTRDEDDGDDDLIFDFNEPA